ncbi:MAG: SDR family oxidoreductase [bacterium]|nr:SDR family oxidoreductase [bacterium]
MAKRKIEGKNVVITGGGGGLGSALAREFGFAGANVALLDIDFGNAVVAADGVPNTTAIPVECDVTDPESCAAAIATAEEKLGPTDFLINNAGIAHHSLYAETDLAVLQRVMDVNFWGAVHCTNATLASITERRGVIVIISSTAGFAPLLGRAGYAASKHAMVGLFGTLRSELRGTGVDVMIASPSSIDTPLRTNTLAGDGSLAGDDRPRVGSATSAADVAERIVWAIERHRSTLVLGRVGIISRYLNAIAPGAYERMMTRSLRSEPKRQ